MTVHVIYGSDSGRTKAAAGKIAAKLDGKVINIKDATVADFEGCDFLVLGSPTYDEGNLQADWVDGVDVLAEADLTGKKVALFGLGDQATYPDNFVDALGTLYDAVVERGAEVVGFTDTKGYEFESSTAARDGQFVGLVLDQDNQAGKSEKRIAAWTSQIL
ncbi:Flavodoxin-B [uncultured Pleomorphomonas sp.]|uniref:Flavodoxin n=1 Tax=uncultured Pleomorphomonas sp. TaxID=442121 RepID=A0A212LDL1_9HYPH|nr:flavodoxin FldA [uncultured Pleomorphomonas sp.]SCM75631.1 Flavodoxin-B [uncultured Pleomorphomonas sp.]